jgi:excisionase family DNA binding protein
MNVRPISNPSAPRMLYSIKNAAYLLSLSTRQVNRLIANKHLLTQRIGGRVLIPYGELKRFTGADHFNISPPAR